MSPFRRKLRKLKRDPRQFIVDTRQYRFIKKNFDIELTENIFFDMTLDSVESLLIKKSEAKSSSVARKKIKSEYESFDLVVFKRNYPIIGHNESYLVLMRLWQKYPWYIKLIKAQVYLMDQKQEALRIVEFLEEAVEKYNDSKDIKLLYLQYLRKAGIYNISKTIEIVEGIIQKNPKDLTARYYLCQFLWEAQGLSPYLMDNIAFLNKKKEHLSTVQKNFICACLYESGKYTDAYNNYKDIREEVSRKYFTLEMLYEKKELDENTRIAYYNSINEFQTQFENVIKNAKKIAIVGNAPSELGLCKGSEIDSSDVIIRFNNFAIGGDFGVDYGYSTDFWVKGGYYIDIGRKDVSQFKGVIQSGNNPLYRNSSFDDFYLDSKISNIDYTFIPPKVYYELIHSINTSPSAGLAILYWIFLIRGELKSDWIYGFSYGLQKNNTSEHYFRSSNKGRFYPHNWSKEAEFLDKIITK